MQNDSQVKLNKQDQRYSTADWALFLHVADPDLILGISMALKHYKE